MRNLSRQSFGVIVRAFCALFLLAAISTTSAASSKKEKTKTASPGPWRVVKIGNHDYLTVDNIAEFYGLPAHIQPVEKTIHLENEKGELDFTLGSRETKINGVRNWLSFPVLEKDGQFLVSRLDLAETIEPQMRPQMISHIGKIKTVVIDPGHGGYDKGAISRFGCEKDYTLDVARQLRPLLQARGFKVLMTREGDYFVPLEVRARIANAVPDAIFVSVHFNAADINPNAAGFEIYSLTPRGAPSTHDDLLKANAANAQAGTAVDTHSIELSSCIYHSLIGHVGEFDRGMKRARFAVLRQTKLPSVLIEGGFLTEGGESRLIANKEWRGKLAQAITVGIDNYKSLADKKLQPLLVRDYTRKEAAPLTTNEKLESPDMGTPASPEFLPGPSTSSSRAPLDLTTEPIVP